jgi:hypothetical protein
LHLAVVGDIGYSNARLDATAAAITELDARQRVDALAVLGDNVYRSGDPARLVDTVFLPFGDLFDDGVDLCAVLGNHDVKDGNAPGQVATLDMPERW